MTSVEFVANLISKWPQSKQELLDNILQVKYADDIAAKLPQLLSSAEIQQIVERVIASELRAPQKVSLCCEYIRAKLPETYSLYDKLTGFASSIQTTVTMEWLQATNRYFPDKAVQNLKQIDELIVEFKKSEQSARLIQIYTIAIHANLLTKNIQKSKSLTMTARSIKCRLNPAIQKDLDYISGCAFALSGEYMGAAGFFQEANAYAQLALCKLASNSRQDLPQVLETAVKNNLDVEQVSSCARIGELVKNRDYLKNVEELLGGLQGDLFTQQLKQTFLESELYQFISGVLKPYSAIQMEQLQLLTQLDAAQLRKRIIELIVQGRLPYKLDGYNLVKCVQEDGTSVALLREAVEIAELLAVHIK